MPSPLVFSALVRQYLYVLHVINGRHSILHIPPRRSRYALGMNRRVHVPVFYGRVASVSCKPIRLPARGE